MGLGAYGLYCVKRAVLFERCICGMLVQIPDCGLELMRLRKPGDRDV